MSNNNNTCWHHMDMFFNYFKNDGEVCWASVWRNGKRDIRFYFDGYIYRTCFSIRRLPSHNMMPVKFYDDVNWGEKKSQMLAFSEELNMLTRTKLGIAHWIFIVRNQNFAASQPKPSIICLKHFYSSKRLQGVKKSYMLAYLSVFLFLVFNWNTLLQWKN